MEVNFKENNVIEVVANADVFVIPNHAARISSYFENFQNIMKDRAKKVLSDNGKEFDEDSFYNVECWFVSKEDLNSDNMSDHGFSFVVNDERYRVFSGEISSNIPRDLLPLKEGDTSIYKINDLIAYKIERDENGAHLGETEYKLNLTLTLKANQRNYRYRSFGDFEDVVRRVCR